MRIGMLLDMYKPHMSGVTTHVQLIKRVLEEQGHQVRLFTFGRPHPEDEPGVVRSPGVPLGWIVRGLHLNLWHSREARALLRTMDVLHAHHPVTSALLGLRYARRWGIPVVFTAHSRYALVMRAYLPWGVAGVASRALQAYLPRLGRALDLTIAPGESVYRHLLHLGVPQDRVVLLPYGVDLEAFDRPVAPLPRAALGLREEDFVLMYIGRLAPEKNLDLLLRALKRVTAAYPQARLVLVGDGPVRRALERQREALGLRKHVLFVGEVPHAAVPRYLRMANLFVVPSVTEVGPIAAIEAMAAGLPVVGVRALGVGDIVQDGVTGLLTANHETALAEALRRLIAEPETLRRMGEAARRAARERDIRRFAKRLVALYRQLAARKRTARRAFSPERGA